MSNYLERVEQLRQGACGLVALPQYQCHKKVFALKIAAIEFITPMTEDIERLLESVTDDQLASAEIVVLNMVGAIITPEESGYAPFGVTKAYVDKHNPQPGGYWVQYEGGYQSWSPAKEFEDGYAPLGHHHGRKRWHKE